MYARSVCVVHAYQVSAHSSAAHAYSKRRGGSLCHRRLREVPSGCVWSCGVRVDRRTRVLTGRISFVSINIRSVAARDPPPDLYRGVGDASHPLVQPVATGGNTLACDDERGTLIRELCTQTSLSLTHTHTDHSRIHTEASHTSTRTPLTRVL